MTDERQDPAGRAGPMRRTGLVLTVAAAVAATVTGAPPALGARFPGDLVLTTVHDGPFEAGGAGTFSIDVTADPASAGIGYPTEVTYYFPAGLTPVRASGAGWRCRITAGSVGCETRDLASPGFQLPRITVGVTVAGDATGTLTASGRAVEAVPAGTRPATATVASTVQIVPSTSAT
ncbi:hypothetical protein [Streptosporangium amethystogenes]|uniref:hypothetical protein n=1 Tax=Streptosporangium amethystogenes TaxID=2002 RepID=UPI0012FBF22C|nr:hypothetical protein [Streptosporangium amethystogenes]